MDLNLRRNLTQVLSLGFVVFIIAAKTPAPKNPLMARRGNMADGLPARACFRFRCIIADRRPSVTSVCEKLAPIPIALRRLAGRAIDNPQVEPPFDKLADEGLSPEYVYRETRRAVDSVANESAIYARSSDVVDTGSSAWMLTRILKSTANLRRQRIGE